MLFRELEIGDKFEWGDIVFQKTGIATAKGNGTELVFSGRCKVTVLRELVHQ